jgi:hypothetical protein
MNARYRRAVMIGLVCVYLGSIGFLSGMLVERMRFDLQRATVLTRLADTEKRLRAHLMEIERALDARRAESH